MLRLGAHIISIVFHPLLMLTYMLLMMLVVNPFMFGYRHAGEADSLILMVFLTSALIPLIAIFVMKGIGWVQSLEMPDKQERIGPYIVTGVLYLTLYLHFNKARVFPEPLLIGTLGSVISLFTGFFANNFRKVSIHAIATGGLLVLTGILYAAHSTSQFTLDLPGMTAMEVPTIYLLYVVIILAGLICSSRLIAGSHSTEEVFLGFFIGVLGMCLAAVVR